MLKFKSLFFFIFGLFSLLQANDVDYSFHLSTTTPYEKEGVLLEVNLTQLNHDKVMIFNFSLPKSEDYDVYQIEFKEHEAYHALVHRYRYLLYPKKSGDINITFNMVKSITNDANVAYAISGDRDNVKGLEKEDFAELLKPLSLTVKKLPLGTVLVGDFTLTNRLDKNSTQAYNPINLSVILKGSGFLAPFELLKQGKAYKLFSQKPKFKTQQSKMGSNSTLQWDYAFSAKESFSLPKVTLKAFNPKIQKSYVLGFPAYKIEVKEVKSSTLLDKEDYPPRAKGVDWDFWGNFLSYVIVFVAGFLMPRDLFRAKEKKLKTNENILSEKISEAKTHKTLLQVLLLENNVKFTHAIKALESVVYNGDNISLNKIKSSLRG